jgi:hypothetical protein
MADITVVISIVVGVVSGILTVVLIWIIVKLFNNTILPWYQGVIYREQKIDGDWEGYSIFFKKDAAPVPKKCSIINLEQKGNFIKGDYILIKQPGGEKCSKKYALKGFFYNGCLVLTYEVVDKKRFGLGACVLRLTEDGQKLDGYWTAMNAVSDDVFSTTEYWVRER